MTITQHDAAEELVEAFALLGDWEERYRFIIDLGRRLEPLDESLKIEAHRVHGCQSTVYLVPRIQSGDPPIIDFQAQSDAAIVNGLIAILRRIYADRPAPEVLAFDAHGLLKRLGLDEHLSPTRRNGLHEMVKRIQSLARRAMESAADADARPSSC
ncbi:MAG: SufE family protein [Phycisphaeraceae bacterium]|nr:SufE family protein [Phycisphaeraceae bacterium]